VIRRRTHTRAFGRLLAVSTVVAGTLAVPATGFAGGGLTTSDPPDRSILATAPAAVELTFSEPVDPRLSHVTTLDGSGSAVNAGALAGDGATLRQPVAIRIPGDVTVAYHVSFREGGESQGSVRFSVGTGRPPAALTDRSTVAGTDAAGHDHGIDPLSAVLLVVDAAVAFGVVVLLLLKPRRRTPPPGEPALGLPRKAPRRTTGA
jgi:methionine-rich copper-binding protein CopC